MFLPLIASALVASVVAQDGPPPPPLGRATRRADADGDGTVTREEMLAQAAERFDRMDVNKDGKLTADEFERGVRMGPGRERGVGPVPATPPQP